MNYYCLKINNKNSNYSTLTVDVSVLSLLFFYFPGFFLQLSNIPPMLVVQYYFKKRRAFASGISLTGHSLGTMVCLPLLRFFVWYYGLRGAMLVHAGLVLQMLVFAMLYRPIETMNFKVHEDKKDTLLMNHHQDLTNDMEKSTDVKESLDKSDGIEKSKEIVYTIQQKGTSKEGKQCLVHNVLCKSLAEKLNLKLFLESSYVRFLIGTLCSNFGLQLMYSLTPIKATAMGMDKFQASLLPSCIGLFSTMSRVTSSLLGNLQCLNLLIYCGSALVLMGLVTILPTLAWDFATLAPAMALYGMCIGNLFFHKTLSMMA